MHVSNPQMKGSEMRFTSNLSLGGDGRGFAEQRECISSTTGAPHLQSLGLETRALHITQTGPSPAKPLQGPWQQA